MHAEWYTVAEGVVMIGTPDPNEGISLSPAGLYVTLGGVFVGVPAGGVVVVEEERDDARGGTV